ncbi:MAG: Ig-like domain-containing protein [Prevotella sp.]|nr:Ig-like domain-containing protein [Prevotella sp.]
MATVSNDGTVTAHAAGETTITATWAGNSDWEGGSAEYTLTVQNPPKQNPTVSFPQSSYEVKYGDL